MNTEQLKTDRQAIEILREEYKAKLTGDQLVSLHREIDEFCDEEELEPLNAQHEFINLVCERYATAKAKASCEATLKKASESAVVRGYCAGCERAGLLHCAHADSCGSNVVIVDKSSINHPSNIVIL